MVPTRQGCPLRSRANVGYARRKCSAVLRRTSIVPFSALERSLPATPGFSLRLEGSESRLHEGDSPRSLRRCSPSSLAICLARSAPSPLRSFRSRIGLYSHSPSDTSFAFCNASPALPNGKKLFNLTIFPNLLRSWMASCTALLLAACDPDQHPIESRLSSTHNLLLHRHLEQGIARGVLKENMGKVSGHDGGG